MFKQIRYDVLDSTNLEAKRLSRPGLCIVANEQVSGKGRFERTWESSLGGVYVSLTLDVLPFSASLLAVASALAVREVVASFGAETSVKWPNDVLIDGKKVAGILIEAVHGENALYIIGVGINTHNVLSDSLQNATALGSVDNTAVVEALCSCFEKYLSEFSAEEVIAAYSEHCVTLGNEITVEDRGKRYSGLASKVTPQGYLVLETASGAMVMQDGTIVS